MDDINQIVFEIPEADNWIYVYRDFMMLTSRVAHKELLLRCRELEEKPVG